ncbi:hypothetical protein U5A82_17380 [Sphingobium sp. CR2-8]|uniref:hypothetical protein n=1 Tax=Sphingobium sp. CR2-8 TaxID=1306534 RepID=UPI002DBAC327|nr:hypothetical protein [Sphingobium sp. CR2-8]MEC3912181.1 hypothetical protein [Sphingobium sp. CR2-8]
MAGWQGVDPAKWAGNLSTTGLTALLRNSVQALANEAGKTIPNGGRVPVKTGNLARSVVISLTPPTIKDGDATGDVTSALAVMKPGDTIYLGWQANYSRRQNNGFAGTDSLGRTYNQAGFGFAEATAVKWPSIVQEQAMKMRGK